MKWEKLWQFNFKVVLVHGVKYITLSFIVMDIMHKFVILSDSMKLFKEIWCLISVAWQSNRL